MDKSTRLKALARLAQSQSSAAQQALTAELQASTKQLEESADYDSLEYCLSALETIGFRFSESVVLSVTSFMLSIDGRELRYAADYERFNLDVNRYRNSKTLLAKAIEVLTGLRYLQTPAVTRTLLWASIHPSKKVQEKAHTALATLAKYDADVFSGNERYEGIGAQPQMEVTETLNQLDEKSLLDQSKGVLTLVEGMLSTSMERADWGSETITFYRGVTPADPTIITVRTRCIELLKKLYSLTEELQLRISILGALSVATRAERGATLDDAYMRMIAQSTCSVLDFFLQILASSPLQLIEKMEHKSYWVYRHTANPEVRSAALKVKAAIDANPEYGIYKALIGFEGVFGDWEAETTTARREHLSQENRELTARNYAQEVSEANSEQWRSRILTFSETQSTDLATFPTFYEFLEEVAKRQPQFAMKLLTDDIESMTRFVIPLLRGLWVSELKDDTRTLVRNWIANAQTGNDSLLLGTTRLFLSAPEVDCSILEEIFERASRFTDTSALNQLAAVAIARCSDLKSPQERLKALFLSCLKVLTDKKDASWVRDVWYRKEAKQLIAELGAPERATVLTNLQTLMSIDSQAEDILAVIAEHAPLEVVDFFCARCDREQDFDRRGQGERFEAVPFDFHDLQEPLSRHPAATVGIIFEHFRRSSYLFQFRGARLLRNIFPNFSAEFERELMKLVKDGADVNYDFVVGIMRAYSGEKFLHPLCKELVKRLPSDSPLLQTIATILESTGVVSGQFGRAEAYEAKRVEILEWLTDSNESVRAFASWYAAQLETMRDSERQRAEESLTLRKFRYGEA